MLRRFIHTSAIRFSSEYPKGKSGKYLTPYMAYAQSIRSDLVKEYPELKVTEIASKLGEKWRELPEPTKEQWKAEYAKLTGK